MYHNFLIHSSANGHLGCFQVLAIVNSAAVNTGVHVSFSILVFSRYMLSIGIAGSYGNFIPSFLRNLHTVLHSAKLLQSYLTLCDHMDYSPPGFSVHEILQARILEWVAMTSSRGSLQPMDQTHVSWGSCIAARFFTTEPLLKPQNYHVTQPSHYWACILIKP